MLFLPRAATAVWSASAFVAKQARGACVQVIRILMDVVAADASALAAVAEAHGVAAVITLVHNDCGDPRLKAVAQQVLLFPLSR